MLQIYLFICFYDEITDSKLLTFLINIFITWLLFVAYNKNVTMIFYAAVYAVNRVFCVVIFYA